jgi:hypothetical protein
MSNEIITLSDKYTNYYKTIEFYPVYINSTQIEIYNYSFNPKQQYPPDSEDKLAYLNTLTEPATPAEGCASHDKWVYDNTDGVSCGDYPSAYINTTILIGEKACFSVWNSPPTDVEKRYETYVATCDKDQAIKASYEPLFMYANSSHTVFQNVSSYYNSFMFAWSFDILIINLFKEAADYVKILANDQLVLLNSYISPAVDNRTNCASMQAAIKSFTYYECKWSASLSLQSLLLALFGIIGIFYGFLRVNFVRYLKAKGSKEVEENYIKFLPAEPRISENK